MVPAHSKKLYHVAFKSRSRRRRGIDAGVHFSMSRSMTRRQQRYAHEGDLVLRCQKHDHVHDIGSGWPDDDEVIELFKKMKGIIIIKVMVRIKA